MCLMAKLTMIKMHDKPFALQTSLYSIQSKNQLMFILIWHSGHAYRMHNFHLRYVVRVLCSKKQIAINTLAFDHQRLFDGMDKTIILCSVILNQTEGNMPLCICNV